MKFGAPFGVGKDAFEDFESFVWVHVQAGFLAGLAADAIGEALARFENAPRQTPPALQWFLPPFD